MCNHDKTAVAHQPATAKGPAAMGRLAFTLFVLAGLASQAVSDRDHPEPQSLKRRAQNDAAIELQGPKVYQKLEI